MKTTTKIVLGCLNLIFWIGCVLIAILLFIHHEAELDIPIPKLEHFKLPLDLNMVILFLLALTGTLGFVTIVAHEERKKIHMTIFSSILILLTLLLGCISYLEYYNREFITAEYLDQFNDSIFEYNGTGESNRTDWEPDHDLYDSDDVDRIQTNFKCCGSMNYTDFNQSPWGKLNPYMVPSSCCNLTLISDEDCRPLDTRNETEFINQVGCTSQVKHVFLHWLDTLIVIQICMAIFTFVGIVGSAVWIRSRRQRAVPYDLVPEDADDDSLIN